MEQICALLVSSAPTITLQFMTTDRQQNASDCGLFSLAFSTALCVGEDPQGLEFDQKVMRSHLLSCLVDGELNPFPCKKMTRRCKTKKTCKIAIHCRTQERGNMVECERCEEWFHQDCAKVPHHIWMDNTTPWFCDSCTK